MPLPSWQAVGTADPSSPWAPAWPTHIKGDVGVCCVESSDDGTTTVCTGTGWVEAPRSPQVVAGVTRTAVFLCRATGSSMPAPTITGPSDHAYTIITTVRNAYSGGTVLDAIIASGGRSLGTVSGSGFQISGADRPANAGSSLNDSLWMEILGWSADSASGQVSSFANGGLTSPTERTDAGTATGNGGGIWVGTGVSSGNGDSSTVTWAGSQSANGITLVFRPELAYTRLIGTAQSGTGSVTPAWPTHRIGDYGLLFVESENEAITLTTPNGFTLIDVQQGANDSRIAVYGCRATSAAMSSPVVADPGDHVHAVIITVAGAGKVHVVAGDTGTGTTATIPSVTTTYDGCLVIDAVAHGIDSASSQFSAWTNANLINVQEIYDAGTTSSNGGGIGIAVGTQVTAGSTGTTDTTVASSNHARIKIAIAPDYNETVLAYPPNAAALATMFGGGTWTAAVAHLFNETSAANAAAQFGTPTYTKTNTPTQNLQGPGDATDRAAQASTDTTGYFTATGLSLVGAGDSWVYAAVVRLNVVDNSGEWLINLSTVAGTTLYVVNEALTYLTLSAIDLVHQDVVSCTDGAYFVHDKWSLLLAVFDGTNAKVRIGIAPITLSRQVFTSANTAQTAVAALTLTDLLVAQHFLAGDTGSKIAWDAWVAGSGVAGALAANLDTALATGVTYLLTATVDHNSLLLTGCG